MAKKKMTLRQMKQLIEINEAGHGIHAEIQDLIRRLTAGGVAGNKKARQKRLGQPVKHLIDCDARPMTPENWSIRFEGRIQNQVRGQIELDPAKIGLFLTDKQKAGYEIGNDLKKALVGQPVLPANVLDYLLAHPELIPESWKGKHIIFWGTIYYDSDGDQVVRYLGWSGGRWYWDSLCLDFKFSVNYPAAVAASIA